MKSTWRNALKERLVREEPTKNRETNPRSRTHIAPVGREQTPLIALLVLLVIVVAWLSGTLLLWRIPLCPDTAHGTNGRWDASLIVPARNEERNLNRLLESLNAQSVRFGELIVVDDQSSDRTAAVARKAGATVVRPGASPEGWTGKTWACWAGAQKARGPVLVFMDADLTVDPGGVSRLKHCADRHPGLITVQPYHRTRKLYEGLSAVFNLVQLMGVGAFTVLGRRVRPAGGFGPCVICTREDYTANGGHRAVRGQVLEHYVLARRFMANGMNVTCLGGRGTVSFRMYPDGLGDLAEGWTKAFATGAGMTPASLLTLTVTWLTGALLTGVLIVTTPLRRNTRVLRRLMAAYVAFVGQIWWMLRRVGRFPVLVPFAFPVYISFFLLIFVRSCRDAIVRRRVTWKGRTMTGSRQA